MKATKVNAGLAESNGRLLLGIWSDSLYVTCGLGWLKNKSIVSFIIIFSTLSFPVETVRVCVHVRVIWPSNSAVK